MESPAVAVDRPAQLWAVAALVSLALLVVVVAAEVVLRPVPVLALVAGAGAGVVVALAPSWWAVTTRRGWKRAACLAVVGVVALGVVAGGLAFTLS